MKKIDWTVFLKEAHRDSFRTNPHTCVWKEQFEAVMVCVDLRQWNETLVKQQGD